MPKREVFHNDGDVLNIMTLEFEENFVSKPHYNVGRDELLVVLSGKLEIVFYDKYLTKVSSEILEKGEWVRIAAESIHQLKVLTSPTKVIEALGGVFKEGCCIQLEERIHNVP